MPQILQFSAVTPFRHRLRVVRISSAATSRPLLVMSSSATHVGVPGLGYTGPLRTFVEES